jgi:hypothetical protein
MRDAEVDDEDRLAAALVVLALTRAERIPTGDLARWRARRLAALGATTADVTPGRSGRRAR